MQISRIAPWTFNPFIRILPAFVLGILLGVGFRLPVVIPLFLIFFLISILVSSRYLGTFYLSQLRKPIGCLTMLIIVCAGLLVTWVHDPVHHVRWYGKNLDRGNIIRARLVEEPVSTPSGFRATAEMVSMVSGKTAKKVSGKVLLYFREVDTIPAYGDILLIRGELRELNGALNPGAFNFQKYAANKGIHHALYLNDKNFFKTGAEPYAFVRFLNSCRRNILAIFRLFFPEQEVRGIAAALLIGYRADLEKPLLQEYSNAGVVHVIAISGLHLGLIYVVLVWLFSQMKFLRKYVVLRCWMVLTLLWLFSLLTGGSASVLRSAVMFSCILIGETYFKKSGTWNVMAASAFLLLVYDPLLLYDVGFLLSYAAVAGIVAWQRPLYQVLFISNKAIRQIWNMASITIVAQLAAFPLCLYYFHQFPNLFLFTNLVVVPLSTVILFGEVIFLLLSSVPCVNTFLAEVLRLLIVAMNDFVSWSNQLPFSSTQGIFADLFSTAVLYVSVVCFAAWLLFRRRSFAIPACMMLCVFSLYFFYLDVNAGKQQKLIFYHAYNGLVIDFIYGRKVSSVFYQSGEKLMEPDQYTQPARITFRAEADSQVLQLITGKHEHGFQIMNTRLMILNRAVNFERLQTKVKVDYLVLTGNPSLKIKSICAAVEPSLVVLDATNSPWKIAQWKKECEQLHLRCFSIRDNGALVSALHPASRNEHR